MRAQKMSECVPSRCPPNAPPMSRAARRGAGPSVFASRESEVSMSHTSAARAAAAAPHARWLLFSGASSSGPASVWAASHELAPMTMCERHITSR
jgi:hypothetical protein